MKINSRMIFLAVLVFGGCSKFDELTKFELDYSEEVVIPSTVGINLPFNIFTPEIETDSESTFEVNDTRKDLIEEILLKSLQLTLTAPENGDFSFLESIGVFLSADGLPEIEVAWLNEISEDSGDFLELMTTEEDLKDYIKEDAFTLRVNTVTDELITADHHIDLYSVFSVDAKILGQ
ncbi:MAG: hypothetical protein DWQ02_06980 [Bacteroidetes bacterium]|nr:MAG: hypothetical protein DWQ02_06980 [Bacteroidota bacterium]